MSPFEHESDDVEFTDDGQVKTRGKAGRPRGSTKLQPSEDLWKQINGLARIQCTQREAAAVLGVHEDTFRDFLRSHESAADAWHSGIEQGKASLRREQYKNAQSGNATMQIWLGKQWLGQRDQIENRTTFVSESPDDVLTARAAELIGKAGTDLDLGGTGAEEGSAQAGEPVSGEGAAAT
jgi:hypothetical protein